MVYYREKDEPSIGLHPANIVGLNGVMYDLVADAGEEGGRVIAQGTLSDLAADGTSKIAPFLTGRAHQKEGIVQ